MKQRWKATPIEDGPVMRSGEMHVLLCNLDRDPERRIEVQIGDKDAARQLGEDLIHWADRVD